MKTTRGTGKKGSGNLGGSEEGHKGDEKGWGYQGQCEEDADSRKGEDNLNRCVDRRECGGNERGRGDQRVSHMP